MALERVSLANFRTQWVIPLLLAPVIFGVGIFAYIPAFEAIRHSFFNWDGMFKHAFLETIGQLEGAARWQRQSWSAVYSSWPRADQNLKSRVLVYKTPHSERA